MSLSDDDIIFARALAKSVSLEAMFCPKSPSFPSSISATENQGDTFVFSWRVGHFAEGQMGGWGLGGLRVV